MLALVLRSMSEPELASVLMLERSEALEKLPVGPRQFEVLATHRLLAQRCSGSQRLDNSKQQKDQTLLEP